MRQLLLCVLCVSAVSAADPEVARLLSDVIRIDTSNPPGNEAKLAEFLESKFAGQGFEIDIIPTPQPGKSHFIARLRGDGTKRPILLAGHEDVVGVEREKWSVDPFAGVIRDGYVWGRGAIDFKGGLAIFALSRGAAVAAPPRESPKSGILYDALVKQAQATWPRARVTPYLFQAGTDAAAWRSRGVPVYGIYPYPITAQDLERMHGNDERVPIASLESGLRMITGVLLDVAAR
ncbi:MAG TPA: M20/M25/M40 family metallo-hydrolase [Verrucomicrobiae bacterium]|nr:M20/M25/M40 family metallo-hydrolase [Verrucomicrobiae bacterium]